MKYVLWEWRSQEARGLQTCECWESVRPQIIFVFFLFFFLSKWYRSWKLNKVSSVTHNILHYVGDSSHFGIIWGANISKCRDSNIYKANKPRMSTDNFSSNLTKLSESALGSSVQKEGLLGNLLGQKSEPLHLILCSKTTHSKLRALFSSFSSSSSSELDSGVTASPQHLGRGLWKKSWTKSWRDSPSRERCFCQLRFQ